MANLQNLKDVINLASNGLFSDEFELSVNKSFTDPEFTLKSALTSNVMVADLPTRNTNTQEAYLRGIPIVRRGRTTYAGTVNFTFLEGLTSPMDDFFQTWFDAYEIDVSGSKSMASKVFLDFVLTQYKPDRQTVSRVRKLYYCLPQTFQSLEGGHQERASDIARAQLTVHYTFSRSGKSEADCDDMVKKHETEYFTSGS
jgi:hypothetical protein